MDTNTQYFRKSFKALKDFISSLLTNFRLFLYKIEQTNHKSDAEDLNEIRKSSLCKIGIHYSLEEIEFSVNEQL